MTILQHIAAPKPLLFLRVRAGGLLLSFVCLGILLWPSAMPFVVRQTAGCLYAAGVVAAVVCQLTTGGKTFQRGKDGRFIKRK